MEIYKVTPNVINRKLRSDDDLRKEYAAMGLNFDGPEYGVTYYDPVRNTTIGYGLHKVAHNAYDNASAMKAAYDIAEEKGYKLLRVDFQKTLTDIFVDEDFQKHFPYTKTAKLAFTL